MRVATFNIFSGRAADGTYDERRFGESVAALDADVLALQEVDRCQPRSGGADLTAVAAEAMGAVAGHFAPALTGTPDEWEAATGDEPDDTPSYGIALLSRRRIRSWRVLRIAPAPVRMPYWWDGRPALVRDEPRTAIVAEVETRHGPLDVVATHLSFLRPWNRVQLRRLLAAAGTGPHPRVLIGDLNLGPRRALRITGLTPAAVGLTFPADRPREQIDHILTSPDLRARHGRAVRLPVSDHRALLADLSPGLLPGR